MDNETILAGLFLFTPIVLCACTLLAVILNFKMQDRVADQRHELMLEIIRRLKALEDSVYDKEDL